jgi:hypothetical protein
MRLNLSTWSYGHRDAVRDLPCYDVMADPAADTASEVVRVRGEYRQ